MKMLISSHTRVTGAGELIYWSRTGKSVMPGFPNNYTAETAQDRGEIYGFQRKGDSSFQFYVARWPKDDRPIAVGT